MKTTPLVLGIASDTPNLQMVTTLFSRYYNTDISNPINSRSVLIGESTVRILTLRVDDMTQRIMSGDIFLGIAGLGQFIESFGKQGKIPLEDMTKFGYRDDAYRAIKPIYELVGDEDANRFGFKKTTKTEEIQGRNIPFYDVPFSVDDRGLGDEISDMDFPIGVNSLRTLRKRPDAKSTIKDLQEKVLALYSTSSYYCQKYPRG